MECTNCITWWQVGPFLVAGIMALIFWIGFKFGEQEGDMKGWEKGFAAHKKCVEDE